MPTISFKADDEFKKSRLASQTQRDQCFSLYKT